jgi:hydroxymethylbilane synthase
MRSNIVIGTRESELAVWQAMNVSDHIAAHGVESRLEYINSEGDQDLQTPLYEMGVQGIFTRSLDIALLEGRIDIAVHSMKDVPTQLPQGIVQGAVLKRGNPKDLLVLHPGIDNSKPGDEIKIFLDSLKSKEQIIDDELIAPYTIATSSIRRKAQWLHRYPGQRVENIRGNVNTRLEKLSNSTWTAAIFAAAGLERINRKPAGSIELDWMLPAPAQGAIVVLCRSSDEYSKDILTKINDDTTEMCTRIEKDFLRQLLGGCSTPISAFAQADKKDIHFRGSILSIDGKNKVEIERYIPIEKVAGFGSKIAIELLANGGQEIAESIRNA